jgi:hypothetical protein
MMRRRGHRLSTANNAPVRFRAIARDRCAVSRGRGCVIGITASVEWGPVAVWVGAVVTFLSVLIALAIALGLFESFRGPRIRITFEQAEPWCRTAALKGGGEAFWIRVGVENIGRKPARSCVGRMISLTTDGVVRPDVDPIQLRWAGVPRARSFDAIDLRRDQREYLNVLSVQEGSHWRIVTFEESDFDPGFSTEILPGHEHLLTIAVFSDNADTTMRDLFTTIRVHTGQITVHMRDGALAGAISGNRSGGEADGTG